MDVPAGASPHIVSFNKFSGRAGRVSDQRVVLLVPSKSEECPVASPSAMDKAAAAFKKQEQAREGENAMSEYRAAQIAEEKKTLRLRALRLARESAAAAEASTLVTTSKNPGRKRGPRKPR
jgi:hypothetical protein